MEMGVVREPVAYMELLARPHHLQGGLERSFHLVCRQLECVILLENADLFQVHFNFFIADLLRDTFMNIVMVFV